MGTSTSVFDDLSAESAALDAVVAELDDAGWRLPTPAAGWTVAHQIAHLVWTDGATLLAIDGPDALRPVLQQGVDDPDGYVDAAAAAGAAAAPGELLDRWRRGRAAVAEALAAVPRGTKLTWFGPPMSAMSMATARLMETWAHGQDIRDALGLPPTNTDRLRNVAHIAYRARDFNYAQHGLTPPAEQFHLLLTGPAGDRWEWGDPASAQQIRGSALDFCLLATQRRHRDDVAVTAVGDDAEQWLTIIQASPAARPRSATGGSRIRFGGPGVTGPLARLSPRLTGRLPARLPAALLTTALLAAGGCGGSAGPAPSAPAGTLTVTSSAFTDGGALPAANTCRGAGTAPPLRWTGVPATAGSIALVVDDPDAPGGTFVHWALLGIPVSVDQVTNATPPAGSEVLPNSAGGRGWTPPCPPSGTHHYRFTVYAIADPRRLRREYHPPDWPICWPRTASPPAYSPAWPRRADPASDGKPRPEVA